MKIILEMKIFSTPPSNTPATLKPISSSPANLIVS